MGSPPDDTLAVVVLAGGRSSEHEVSLSSGAGVRDALLALGHEVTWVEIGEDGVWRRDGEAIDTTPGGGLLGADVAFPALHGPFGEDGTVQGMLETLDIPYVGSGVAASAACLDKVLFKRLMSAAGAVPQVDYVGVREDGWRRSPGDRLAEIERLELPVFVKPAHLGSSLGIVKVTAVEQLAPALDQAFAYEPLAIVEAMARGIEVECGVLERSRSDTDASGSPALASEPGEIVLSSEFYDYQAKYAPGGMELRVPARISQAAKDAVRGLAVEVFEHAGCAGLARVDFFVDGEEVLVNELNTMPGFTPTSVYPKLMEASGIAYAELVDRLCRLALERHSAQRAHSY